MDKIAIQAYSINFNLKIFFHQYTINSKNSNRLPKYKKGAMHVKFKCIIFLFSYKLLNLF